MIIEKVTPVHLATCHSCTDYLGTIAIRLDNGKTQLLLCRACYRKLSWLVRHWGGTGSLSYGESAGGPDPELGW